MEQFSINTSQNVSIVESYASIGERITATVIDLAIMGSYMIVVSLVITLSREWLISFILSIPVLVYHPMFEMYNDGQSPGKRAMRIKVVAEDGTAPSFASIFIRWVFRLIDITLSFGSAGTIFIVTGKKNQRLGDLTAGTILIRNRPKPNMGSIFVQLPDAYSPQYPQVKMLSEEDIHTVREVLDFLKSTRMNQESVLYAHKTKKMLLKKMNLDSKQKTDEFLKTVLRDYNYYNQ